MISSLKLNQIYKSNFMSSFPEKSSSFSCTIFALILTSSKQLVSLQQ